MQQKLWQIYANGVALTNFFCFCVSDASEKKLTAVNKSRRSAMVRSLV